MSSHPENDPKYIGLQVNSGVETPDSVNSEAVSEFLKRNKRAELTAEAYVAGIRQGDISILSQAVTLVESSNPAHQQLAQEVVLQCLPFAGDSIRLGITGMPGAGKSTFIEALGKTITGQGRKLAVLAIDPSSEKTKGSILGDKTRMEELSANANAYIRPSPTSGSLGGVARKTREIITLCEAAGFNTILIETVGVGQSETAVHSMVDFFVLLQLAGAGDELQGIKRGIMEMADLLVVNKSDGDNIDKAQLAAAQYRNALHLFPASDSGWDPKVLTCSALENKGISEVWTAILDYANETNTNGFFHKRRNEQVRYAMYETINEMLKNNFYQNQTIQQLLLALEKQVIENTTSSLTAANQLLESYFKLNSK
jgi:LAO/AO transport system kinase